MDAYKQTGRVIDAEGRLIVPGFHDGHTHPHVPFTLVSPEAPMLFKAKSVEDATNSLREYAEKHPEDKFPRMFGWMSAIFKEGEKPTRQVLDSIIPDRPVYLVHHSGHEFWANTKALQMAEIFEKDPENFYGYIERDPETGFATGYMTETEYAGTDGVLLNTVKAVKPLTFREQTLVLRFILEEYSKVGVTSIWTKDGDIEISKIYEQLLKDDSLPVRATLDMLYTSYSSIDDIQMYADRATELKNAPLPKGFLKSPGAKLILDMPADGYVWLFESDKDPDTKTGKPFFSLEGFREQAIEADKKGLTINVLGLGDRAIHEALNVLEEIVKINPERERRHTIEHAEYIQDNDLGRFKDIGVIAVMNPIGVYPDKEYQKQLEKNIGKNRLDVLGMRWKDLIESGALVVNGSDFPLAPMDPMVGMHLLVNGTDLKGEPEGGLWPHKHISIEQALRTYTVNSAYASFDEDHLGMLKPEYAADFVILSENILDQQFDKTRLPKVKAMLTVFNGHIVHEDFSAEEKVIDFGG